MINENEIRRTLSLLRALQGIVRSNIVYPLKLLRNTENYYKESEAEERKLLKILQIESVILPDYTLQ